jgi:excisionase family DNA binding protein
MLGVTKPRVNQLCEAGRLTFVIVGNARLIERAGVEALAKTERKAGRPKKNAADPKSKKPKGKKA